MSERGWHDFLDADDVDDWVVLHGGVTAAYRVPSLAASAALATHIAALPEVEGAGALLTVADRLLTVRLTRDVWAIEAPIVEVARAVSRVAADAGAAADRSAVQEVQLAISAKADDRDLGFWRAVLGYTQTADDSAADPLGHGSTVWMQDLPDAKALRHAMHIDVSVAREQVHGRLAAALAAGGRLVDDSDAPAHWVLADRAGNKVCICAWPDGSGRDLTP